MGLPPITEGVMADANSQSKTTFSELLQLNSPIDRIFTLVIYATSLITSSPTAPASASTALELNATSPTPKLFKSSL